MHRPGENASRSDAGGRATTCTAGHHPVILIDVHEAMKCQLAGEVDRMHADDDPRAFRRPWPVVFEVDIGESVAVDAEDLERVLVDVGRVSLGVGVDQRPLLDRPQLHRYRHVVWVEGVVVEQKQGVV